MLIPVLAKCHIGSLRGREKVIWTTPNWTTPPYPFPYKA